MIVFDENVHQRSSMDAVAVWYRGRVLSVTALRPGTIIKDEAIPTILRRVLRPTFVTTNVDDFWQRIPAHTRYSIVCLIEIVSRKQRAKVRTDGLDVGNGIALED